MIDYIREFLRTEVDQRKRRLLIREYLQARILEGLQNSGVFGSWCFLGGTALRFLYRLPRFSEDLDFSLSHPLKEAEQGDFDRQFDRIVDRTVNMFSKEGYSVGAKLHNAGVVKSAFIKFHRLLFDLGLSSHEQEVMSIKIEIDTKPPAGAELDSSIIRKHALLNIQHYSKSSLFAGKLHALLSREYTKGRDLYDTLWYLSDPEWPMPNIIFLRNALVQTGWEGSDVTTANWKSLILNTLSNIDWKKASADVGPFLEKPWEVSLLSEENFSKLLS
jgi:predicted nucleotidyltransferase component of viral defense system